MRACRQELRPIPLRRGVERTMGQCGGLACIVLVLLLLAAFPHHASCVSNTLKDNRGPLLNAFNCKKIAFYKTHKTGSTTLAAIMFRAAVNANMSQYSTRSHYISASENAKPDQVNPKLLGRSDMVLRHVVYDNSSTWHAATRAFYARALGTADYGFLTVLRHPVDRYISHFYYFVEPDERKNGRSTTLEAHVSAGGSANFMAHEFSVRSQDDMIQFLGSEMMSDGLYLPVELMDYGLALLAEQCGWGISSVLYMAINTNSQGAHRYDGMPLATRPGLTELAATNPSLLQQISAINALDAMLYGAALSAFLTKLAPGSPASRAGVLRRSARITAARKHLERTCAGYQVRERERRRSRRKRKERMALQAGPGAGAAVEAAGVQGKAAAAADLGTEQELAGMCAWYSISGRVYEELPSKETGFLAKDARLYAQLPSAHSPQPIRSWTVPQMLYTAQTFANRFEGPTAPAYHHLLAGVRVFPPSIQDIRMYGSSLGPAAAVTPVAVLTLMAARWAAHHAKEGFDHLVLCVDQLELGQSSIVRHSVRRALYGSASEAEAPGDVTFEVMECDVADGQLRRPLPGDGGDEDSGAVPSATPGAGRRGAFAQVAERARWSTFLPGLSYFVTAPRGTVRSAMLGLEAERVDAGAVCAPTVAWRLAHARPPGLEAGARREVLVGSGQEQQQQQQQQAEPCVPRLCAAAARAATARCTMIRGMAILEADRVYRSDGTALVAQDGAQAALRVPYGRPTGHSIEVVQLLPPVQDALGGSNCTGSAPPRLLLPWCS